VCVCVCVCVPARRAGGGTSLEVRFAEESHTVQTRILALTLQKLRQYLHFCTSKASKLSTCPSRKESVTAEPKRPHIICKKKKRLHTLVV
jgi:hypothetical protein